MDLRRARGVLVRDDLRRGRGLREDLARWGRRRGGDIAVEGRSRRGRRSGERFPSGLECGRLDDRVEERC